MHCQICDAFINSNREATFNQETGKFVVICDECEHAIEHSFDTEGFLSLEEVELPEECPEAEEYSTWRNSTD